MTMSLSRALGARGGWIAAAVMVALVFVLVGAIGDALAPAPARKDAAVLVFHDARRGRRLGGAARARRPSCHDAAHAARRGLAA